MIGKKTYRIVRLFGIDVELDITWFFVFGLFVIMFTRDLMNTPSLALTTGAAAICAAIMVVLLFASVLAHEFGHALTARIFGIETRRILLMVFGGVAFLEKEPVRPRDEFWISVAGPLVSIALAIGFGIGYGVAQHISPEPSIPRVILGWLAASNGFLALFNCLPGFPMDGGRILRSAIWAWTGEFHTATRIAAYGGIGFGWLFIAWGVAGTILSMTSGVSIGAGPLTALLGWMLTRLARDSSRHATVMAALDNVRIRDLIRPIRAVVPAEITVGEVIERYLPHFRVEQFPVVRGERLIGFLDVPDLQRIPQRQWDWTRVQELTRPFDRTRTVSPDDAAVKALEIFARYRRGAIPVFDGPQLVGYLLRNDLADSMRRSKAA